ncbi:hypothetical protein CAEBREN_07079 [Caenorhabditis brenneri]|uniref:Tyrosine-protein phosphatase domain-containing protein n=1 Tax=Caenorhabditis brenneri TaxID=135651 RepID=G0MJ31_CAEBE|nr:hypothetical protein CAEBREN_07079 [Caenorhabditis brenneri]
MDPPVLDLDDDSPDSGQHGLRSSRTEAIQPHHDQQSSGQLDSDISQPLMVEIDGTDAFQSDQDATQPVLLRVKYTDYGPQTSQTKNLIDSDSDASLLAFYTTQQNEPEHFGQLDPGNEILQTEKVSYTTYSDLEAILPIGSNPHSGIPVPDSGLAGLTQSNDNECLDSYPACPDTWLPILRRDCYPDSGPPGLHRRLSRVSQPDNNSDGSLSDPDTLPYPDSEQPDEEIYSEEVSDSDSYLSDSEDTSPTFLGRAMAYIGSFWPSWGAPEPLSNCSSEQELSEIRTEETRIDIEEEEVEVGEEAPAQTEDPKPETREEKLRKIREQFGSFAPYPETTDVHLQELKEKPLKKMRIKAKKAHPKLYYHYMNPGQSNTRYASTEKPEEKKKKYTPREFFPRNKWANLPEPIYAKRAAEDIPSVLQDILREEKIKNLKSRPDQEGEDEERNPLLEKVYRKLAVKSALMDNHGLYVGVFRELKASSNRYCVEKGKAMVEGLKGQALTDFDYNFKPVSVTLDDSTLNTNATLLKYPEIQRSYIILPGMTPGDAELHWDMIFERKTNVVVQLDRGYQYFPGTTKYFLRVGKYTIYCLAARREFDYIVRELAIVKDVDESDTEVNNLLSKTPVIISSTGLGRAGAFVIVEAVLTMLDQNVKDNYWIENLVYQLATTRRNGIHYALQYKLIYNHLIQMMEMETPGLRSIGIDCRDYAEDTTTMKEPNKSTIYKFLSSDDWPYDKDALKQFGNEASLMRSDQVVSYRTLRTFWWTQLWGPLDKEEKDNEQLEEIRKIKYREMMEKDPNYVPNYEEEEEELLNYYVQLLKKLQSQATAEARASEARASEARASEARASDAEAQSSENSNNEQPAPEL